MADNSTPQITRIFLAPAEMPNHDGGKTGKPAIRVVNAPDDEETY